MSFPQAEPQLPPHVHWAARVEDVLSAGVNRVLRRRGWEPRVLTYTGYGTQDWARVLARVLLTPPGVRTRDVSGARGGGASWPRPHRGCPSPSRSAAGPTR